MFKHAFLMSMVLIFCLAKGCSTQSSSALSYDQRLEAIEERLRHFEIMHENLIKEVVELQGSLDFKDLKVNSIPFGTLNTDDIIFPEKTGAKKQTTPPAVPAKKITQQSKPQKSAAIKASHQAASSPAMKTDDIAALNQERTLYKPEMAPKAVILSPEQMKAIMENRTSSPAASGLMTTNSGTEKNKTQITAGAAMQPLITPPSQKKESKKSLTKKKIKTTPPKDTTKTADSLYGKGLNLVRKGETEKGRTILEEYLENYPKGHLAPNARYWKAESFYHEKNYPKAILIFKTVYESFPTHHKAAAALLKTGMSYLRLGDKANARFYLDVVTKDFPQTEPAEHAKKIINSFKTVF